MSTVELGMIMAPKYQIQGESINCRRRIYQWYEDDFQFLFWFVTSFKTAKITSTWKQKEFAN